MTLSDELGAVVERHVYEAWGAIVGKPAYSGIGYTGHLMDGGTGLTYMQQRYYDQSIGRFLSVDPVAARPVGDNFNRYWYANNNPYRFVDPDGRESACFSNNAGCGLRPWTDEDIEKQYVAMAGLAAVALAFTPDPTDALIGGAIARWSLSAKKITNSTDTASTGGLIASVQARGFASAKLLREHWKKHNHEWGGMTENQYLARAIRFLSGAPNWSTLEYRRYDGSIVGHDTRTGEFGVVSSSGIISTFFRPAMSKAGIKKGINGLDYFLNDRKKHVGR